MENLIRDQSINKEITDILTEYLFVPLEEITPTKSIKSLGADSLDSIEIIMAIEDKFNIEIPDLESDKLTTVQDLIDITVKYKQK